MLTDSDSGRLFVKGTGDTFYRLTNADGKTWLMPVRNMRVGMNLYQPSGRNGKLLKSLFPLLHRIPLVRKKIGAQAEQYRLCEELSGLVGSLFKEQDLEFAVFYGTPCAHQKITVQLSRRQRILGYLKVSDNAEVGALFRHESRVLEHLHRKGVTDIPKCLYCGTLSDSFSVFVQDTTKSCSSKVVHHWMPMHDVFLDGLHRKTHKILLFEESDYYQTLLDLQKHIGWLPKEIDASKVVGAIGEIISEWQGKEVDFSAYHGDFTPWNMFVENGRLFVFDWEYARLTYPPMLDRYHFFTQTLIFERHWEAKDIVGVLQADECRWVNRDYYKLYLLDVISRFTVREKGNAETMTPAMKVWGDILHYLCK